ncbi:MAG TPA: exodeoxyribonuclease VII large subunit, partial [Candidatus Krumholzibacteria bacterium]|nr:exodeoxyribonuclease VII large subunit [Candidatus Krumholzibacteria bacterium]
MSFVEERIFSVAEINALVREMLEGEFPALAIAGEISNLRVPASGHVYFRLKDASAQIAAVCFRGDARRLDVELEDGAQVVARGNLTLYDAQGSYQLVARSIEPAGRGDLERQLRLLMARLREEGLFDVEHKRALPRYPARIAVITSPTGAAVRDILSTLRRRFPCVEVLMVPVQVQGEVAPAQIIAALDAVSEREDVDVVIVGRGGGSIEDLWAFNDEGVARAIHRCTVPVISGVGHETDVTVADFVADVRAATPTMAAELAVPA